jgi:hypothetical protein
VTPHNALRQDLKKQGIKACTINKLMGIGLDDEKTGERKNVDGIRKIVFDEIFMYKVSQLVMIHDFMKEFPDKIYGATGDQFQNDPPGDKYKKEYRAAIIDKLFPTRITLSTNKRITNEEDRKRFYELFDQLKSTDN